MNSVHLIGRLTKDPELSFAAEGQRPYCRFFVAVDRGKDQSGEALGADFLRIVAFGKTAENLCRFTEKGSLICVDGRLKSSEYKDAQGVTRYSTDVHAGSIQFLDRRKTSEDN